MSLLFVIRNNVYAISIRGLMENFVLLVSSSYYQSYVIYSAVSLCKSSTMGCPPVRGDNRQALASGLSYRVPTSSGNHGKPGKSLKKVPCMEKSWNLKKPE